MNIFFLLIFLFRIHYSKFHPINEGDWYYNRIVNGTNANIEDHPEIVSIQTVSDIRSHICGGSLINGFTVLTAAHCIDRQFVSKLQVCHGEINLKYCGNNSIKVKRLIVHERWMRPLLQYDVGLITLVEPVIIERYAVLMSPNYEINTNDLGTVLGWGSLWYNGPSSDILQTVDLDIFVEVDCQKFHQLMIYESNICAGVLDGGRSHCTGDSGGPLIHNNTQVGIVSWSEKPCAQKNSPGVYTRISWFYDWIWNNAQE